MRTGTEVVRLAELAEEQWGMFTTAQSGTLGVTPQALADLARAEHLHRIRHGVYRIPGSPPHPQDELRAAWLSADPQRTIAERLDDSPADPVISHRTAAQLWNIGDLHTDRLEMSSPRRRQARDGAIRYRKRLLAPDQVTILDGLPVTTVLTTITDLADIHTDGSHLGTVISDALATGLTTRTELGRALGPYAHRYRAPLGNGPALVDLLAPADRPATPSTPDFSWGDLVIQVAKTIANPSFQETVLKISALQQPRISPGELAAMKAATSLNFSQSDEVKKAMAQIKALTAPTLTERVAAADLAALRQATANIHDADRETARKGLARVVDSVRMPAVKADAHAAATKAAASVSPREIEAARAAAADLQKFHRKPAK